jgi:hypothetical protein
MDAHEILAVKAENQQRAIQAAEANARGGQI